MGNRKGIKKSKAGIYQELSETQINNLCLFFVIAFYIYLKIFITSRIGLSGAAYAFSAFDFILLFIVLVPYGIKQIVYKFLRMKIRTQQYKNAKRFLYGSFMVVIIYGIITGVLLLILQSFICKEILINSSSKLCLLFLIPAILITGISCVIKGFIQATGNSGYVLIMEIAEKVLMILGVIILSSIFDKYGEKVSLVLMSPDYRYAFGASGACLGITAGLLVSMIFDIFLYKTAVHSLNRNDVKSKSDDIYDIIGWIKNDLFKTVGPFFFIILFFVICQTFFIRSMADAGNKELITYNWGAYNGVLINIILIPTLWIMSKTSFTKQSIMSATRNDNYSELRNKISAMIMNSLSYLIPCFAFTLFASNHIVKGFILTDSDLAFKVLRLGSVLIILLPLCIEFIIMLQSLGQPMLVLLNSIISLVLSVACLIVLTFILKTGLIGIILGSVVGLVVFLMLNFGSIRKLVKLEINIINSLLIPFIVSLVGGIVVLGLNLLLGLFLPSALIVVVCLIIYVMLVFVAYAKLNITNELTLKNAFLGRTFLVIGKTLRLF